MSADWRRFEEAVAEVLQSLDPLARVERDVSLPDRDTGTPRQRDVWISTSFGGHIPISIFVSCKRQKERVDQQDIDAFLGEFRSSRAHVGVIYSYAGFTEPAIAKAKATEVSCCTLYEDEAPSVPEALKLRAFCSKESFALLVGGDPGGRLTTMTALFELPAEEDGAISVIDALVAKYDRERELALSSLTTLRADPPVWSADVTIENDLFESPIAMRLQSKWEHYQAKLEAYRLNGTYSFTNNDFKGTLATPAIERYGNPPGEGWEKIDVLPSLTNQRLHAFLHTPRTRECLIEMFGPSTPRAAFAPSIAAAVDIL